jgi:polyphosphate kinase
MAIASTPASLESVWIDRDLSWLEFNRRVLAQASDKRTPLLERAKFLAIFTSNLDEFFMKRIAWLRPRAIEDAKAGRSDGPAIMAQVRSVVLDLVDRQADCLASLMDELREHGIRIAHWRELTRAQKAEATRYFEENVSPALLPQVVDSLHPFPFLSNLSLSWVFGIRDSDSDTTVSARVKIPPNLPQWLSIQSGVPANERCFLSLPELIRHHLSLLFPGMETTRVTLCRVTRDAEVELDEEELEEDLREAIEESIRLRRYEPVVRIEFGSHPDPEVAKSLLEHNSLTPDDVYKMAGPFDLTSLMTIAQQDFPHLRDPVWNPVVPPALRDPDVDIFSVIRQGDLLVHHPYESFDATVERFVRDAAADPDVLAIKMTVYRVGDDTPFVQSLIRAAESGKQVACVIELTARFDEARNLHWAEQLREAGAHVAYGVLGLKTHAKLALVVRREGDHVRCYCHIGTGNYHVKTARLYTDLGLFTCDPAITSDAVRLFHYLTGRSTAPELHSLFAAPWNMQSRFLDLIAQEIDNHNAGRPARIVAKMNQLEDPAICRALIQASCAGVPIDLIVRGFCCIRPGVAGVTGNIRIRSIIGRLLEHSRIFHFAAGSADPLEGEFLIGSADWMSRNLTRRIEIIAPVKARAHREKLWEILQVCLADERQAWTLESDGTYRPLTPGPDASGPASEGTHAWLMAVTRRRYAT